MRGLSCAPGPDPFFLFVILLSTREKESMLLSLPAAMGTRRYLNVSLPSVKPVRLESLLLSFISIPEVMIKDLL